MEHNSILVKGAVMATIVIIMLATLLSPVITDAAYNHVVQSNDDATDNLDLGYYATTLDGYPGCTIASNSDGTVSVAYPDATKTVSGDAILIVGDSGTISSFVKSGSLCFRQADGTVLDDVKSVTLGAAVSAAVEATVVKSDDTSTVEPIEGAGWYLPTLGGAYGSYTGDIAYDLSDVVAVGYFAGAYIASKNGEVVSTNPYNLTATIERDANGNIAGVKYAKATAEAAAVDGSASAYTGEDPVILVPDDDDGTVAVVTPEEYTGEDANASSSTTPSGTMVGDCYYLASGSAIVMGPASFSATEITILDTVTLDGTAYTVTQILGASSVETGAFGGMTALKKVTCPETMTKIGAYAFMNCTSLQTIALPNDLVTIDNNAFMNCTSLQTIALPAGVTWLATKALYNTSLTALVIDSSPRIDTLALPSTLTEVLNLGSTTLTTTMGITDSTVVSDSIESLAIIQQKSTDLYETKGSEYTLLLIIPILVIVALLCAVISAYRNKMQS